MLNNSQLKEPIAHSFSDIGKVDIEDDVVCVFLSLLNIMVFTLIWQDLPLYLFDMQYFDQAYNTRAVSA